MLILEQPNEEQSTKIYQELNSNRESVRRDVQSLIQWLEKQPHLPNIKDEEFLAHWLLRCKNSVEQAKIVLDRYYSLKAAMPEIYENQNPEDPQIVFSMKVVSFVPIPKLTPEGCRVSVFRILDPTKYEQVHPDIVIKSIFMSADIRLQLDACQSDIFIFDCGNFILPVMSMVMANLKKFVLPGTKGLPMRHRNYYLINLAPSAESLITLTKSFLKKDLLQKLVILNSTEKLSEVIPKQCLPKDYGGEQPSFVELNDSWIETLQHYTNWFKAQENRKADNSKRIRRKDSVLDDISVEGSFRKLALD